MRQNYFSRKETPPTRPNIQLTTSLSYHAPLTAANVVELQAECETADLSFLTCLEFCATLVRSMTDLVLRLQAIGRGVLASVRLGDAEEVRFQIADVI